tara:strand:- start:1347 stop:1613 length:267 start_codon:yes stop_codon:yes gene_type:complete
MNPEEIEKVTKLVQVLRDEVAQLKKHINPIEHCNGTTTKGGSCRNRCIVGTRFCRKHTTIPQEEDKPFSWADDHDNDSLPELGEDFIK